MSEVVPSTNDQALPPVPAEAIHAQMSEEELQRALQINVVDMSHGAVTSAQDHAAEYINRKTTEGRNFVTRFMKKVWHGNLARDYYNLREQRRGVNEIAESGNVHALQDGTEEDHQRTSASVVSRVSQDFLHQDETKRSIAEIDNGAELESQLRGLVRSFAEGTLTRESLVEEKTRLLHEFGRGRRQEDRNKGLVLADNIVEVADSAKTALDHGLGLDRIDAALSAHHTEARMGARTQVRLNAAEKVANKLYQTKLGTLVNETTVAAVASIPFVAGKIVTRKIVTAAAGMVTIGAGSAVIAGVRESLHIKQDRQTHMREMATGGGEALAHAGKRREQLDEATYETVHVEDVLADLRSTTENVRADRAGVAEALDTLAYARTIVSQSDEKSIDLIQFSSRTAVESERFEVDVRIAEARAAVQEVLNTMSDDERQALGIEGNDIGALLDQRSAGVLEVINEDISARDQAFRKLQRKQVAKAAAIGFITSETIGLAMQEAKAAASDSLRGVFEGAGDDQDRRTLLSAVFHHGEGADGSGDSDATHLVTAGPHGKVVLPDGYSLEHHDGQWELSDSQGNVISDRIGFNKDGEFTHATKTTLEAHGFSLAEDAAKIHDPNTATYTDVNRSAADYIAHHKSDFTHVQRQLWYDNDTPGIYDQNELGMWWGGNDGTGMDQHGNYVFNVAHMSPDGSFHDGLSADYQQLIREGKMAVALSINDGTQDHVIMVPMNEHGQAIIGKDTFAGRSLFASHDGHAQFIGKYAEAVQIGDKQNGVQSMRMLATVVGEGRVNEVTDHVKHVVHHSHIETTTTLTAPEGVAQAADIEAPGAIPIAARRGLEYAAPEEQGHYGEYGSQRGRESKVRELMRSPWTSPNLLRSPEGRLNQAAELAAYRERLAANSSPEYLAEVEAAISNDPILARLGEKGDMRAVVTIPVYGAGEQDNIYHTLSLYAQQDEQTRRSTPIILHVNYPVTDLNDSTKRANIEKTNAEIERARQDFPDLEIGSFTTEWSEAYYNQMKQHGGVIRPVVERLFDVALLAVDRGIKEGRIAAEDDVMIIRNDSDSVGMQRNYLGRMIKLADDNPTADALAGPSRWETRLHGDFPGFGVVSNFREIAQAMLTRKSFRGRLQTTGMNSAMRASSLAAIGSIHRYGSDVNQSGAGTDDLEIGHRLYALRVDASRRATAQAYAYSTYAAATSGTARLSRAAARYASRRAGVAATAYAASDAALPDDAAVPVKYATGAQIDTLSGRIMKQYRSNNPISQSWANFSNETRDDNGNRGPMLERENMQQPDAVIDRIEYQLNDMINNWYRDPAVVRASLLMQFGETDKDGDKLYDLSWDKDGKARLTFTKEGREHVVNRLKRDSRGRFEPYGRRMARLLYNKRTPGSTRRLRSQPMFVEAKS